ncbi:MAG: dihydroneopterin aldolase [Kiloniellales bacterium]
MTSRTRSKPKVKQAVRRPAPRAAASALQLEASHQRIFIRDLEVASRVGVTVAERSGRQRLRINLELEIVPRAVKRDKIGEVVDYSGMVDGIRRVCVDSQVKLLETLAERLSALCFDHPRVRAARIRIEKLERYPDVAGIGIEIERRRPSR